MRHYCFAASLALLVGASPASAQYGDLAPGAAMSWSLDGVLAEVAVRFAVDPAFVARRLPSGFRPYTLGYAASRGDSVARAAIRARPELADHVITSLAFARLDSTVVETERSGARPLTLAFWWVPVQLADTGAPLPDARARAGEHVVELALWSADTRFGEQLGAVMPTVSSAQATVTWDHAGGWRMRLTTPEVVIVGSCHLLGPPVATPYPLPAFSTVWAADTVPRAFSVFTYHGHHIQRCRASWQARGEGALARALRTGTILGSVNQIGWRARAAAYAPR